MNRRQPHPPRLWHPKRLPRLWMMTDERQGDALWSALERLPRGAGVVFRHYSLPAAARRAAVRHFAHEQFCGANKKRPRPPGQN